MMTRATANRPGSSGCLLRLLNGASLSVPGPGGAVCGAAFRPAGLTVGPSATKQIVRMGAGRLCPPPPQTASYASEQTRDFRGRQQVAPQKVYHGAPRDPPPHFRARALKRQGREHSRSQTCSIPTGFGLTGK